MYVGPTRGPFHALPAVPKDIFFTDQPVQGPFYLFLRYTVENKYKIIWFYRSFLCSVYTMFPAATAAPVLTTVNKTG